ncbi:hypothetical protein J4226_02010 [Candidatus Pacearchaeota archaeon]|nr:hypothetical protein [Candidatus Pacearchaeota archaeon]
MRKIKHIFLSKRVLITVAIVVLLLVFSFFYNIVLFDLNKDKDKDIFCEYMLPFELKSDCYYDLAKKSGDEEFCVNTKDEARCLVSISTIYTMDINACENIKTNKGDCIKSVLNGVGEIMSKRVNKYDYCNEDETIAVCIDEDFGVNLNDNFLFHIVIESDMERSVHIRTMLCESDADPLDSYGCAMESEGNFLLKKGINKINITYDYDLGRNFYNKFIRGLEVGIKFIKIDIENESFVGIYDKVYIEERVSVDKNFTSLVENKIKNTLMERFIYGPTLLEECYYVQDVLNDIFQEDTTFNNPMTLTSLCISRIKDCSILNYSANDICEYGKNSTVHECTNSRDIVCNIATGMNDIGLPPASEDSRYMHSWMLVNREVAICEKSRYPESCLSDMGILWLDCSLCDMASSEECKEAIDKFSNGEVVCD